MRDEEDNRCIHAFQAPSLDPFPRSPSLCGHRMLYVIEHPLCSDGEPEAQSIERAVAANGGQRIEEVEVAGKLALLPSPLHFTSTSSSPRLSPSYLPPCNLQCAHETPGDFYIILYRGRKRRWWESEVDKYAPYQASPRRTLHHPRLRSRPSLFPRPSTNPRRLHLELLRSPAKQRTRDWTASGSTVEGCDRQDVRIACSLAYMKTGTHTSSQRPTDRHRIPRTARPR